MSSSSQFETETRKEKKTHTQRTLDTHTTKTKGSFPRGCRAAHLPPPQPFSGREAGWEPKGRGWWGWARNEGRKEVAPGPTGLGPQLEYKTCLSLQSSKRREPWTSAMGQSLSTFQGQPGRVAEMSHRVSRVWVRMGGAGSQGPGPGASQQGVAVTVPHHTGVPLLGWQNDRGSKGCRGQVHRL